MFISYCARVCVCVWPYSPAIIAGRNFLLGTSAMATDSNKLNESLCFTPALQLPLTFATFPLCLPHWFFLVLFKFSDWLLFVLFFVVLCLWPLKVADLVGSGALIPQKFFQCSHTYLWNADNTSTYTCVGVFERKVVNKFVLFRWSRNRNVPAEHSSTISTTTFVKRRAALVSGAVACHSELSGCLVGPWEKSNKNTLFPKKI